MPDVILGILLQEKHVAEVKVLKTGAAKVKLCEACGYAIVPGVACSKQPSQCPFRDIGVDTLGLHWEHHEFWESQKSFDDYVESGYRIDGD